MKVIDAKIPQTQYSHKLVCTLIDCNVSHNCPIQPEIMIGMAQSLMVD